MTLPTEITIARRHALAYKIQSMIDLAGELELLRHEAQGLVGEAMGSITVDGSASFPLGSNLYSFANALRDDTKPIAGMSATLTNLLHDWQIKTMKFNKETGEWE